MSNIFWKWLSSKQWTISDRIGDKSNRFGYNLVELENDLHEIQEIKVYDSDQSIIDLIATNSPIPKPKNNNVFEWFNDMKLRKGVLEKLSLSLTDSRKVFEYLENITSNASIKVSANRVQNFLKTFNYSVNNQIFNYSNEYQFQSIGHSFVKVLESQSFILKLIHEIIRCLISGIPLVVVTSSRSSLIVSYFLDLCEESGIPSGVINLVIIGSEKVSKMIETTEPMISPIFIVLESADFDSTVDRIISSAENDIIGSLNVFVQQSVYQKLCERIKTRLINRLEIGDKSDKNVDILSKINVNYDAIDFDNENKSFDVQLFKFRTNAEVRTLINHFTRIPYISLWAEKTCLALELAKDIDSSSVFFINGSVKYPVKVENTVFTHVLDKIEYNSFFAGSGQSFDSVISSQFRAYKKWKTIGSEERLRIIRDFLIKNKTEITQKINPSVLETFGQKITENKDIFGTELVMTDFEPIGLIALKVDEQFNQRTLTLILEALIGGNLLLIDCRKPKDDLIKVEQYLSSLGHKCLHFLDSDQNIDGNKIVMNGDQYIGIQLEDSTKMTRKSLIKFSKSITLSMGDISFAK